MRTDRNHNQKRERVIMISSSALVLAALTLTGVYMKNRETGSKSDGYTIDFSALENSAEQKARELAQQEELEQAQRLLQEARLAAQGESSGMEDDLDYLPMSEDFLSEAGSSNVEIPGLTDAMETIENAPGKKQPKEDENQETGKETKQEEDAFEGESDEEAAQTAADSPIITDDLHFSNMLLHPVNGEVLLPYSMDASVYFRTLDQYKYNPAIIYATAEGSSVSACCAGKVLGIHDDAKLGHVLELDLGDGYTAIYGQLRDICVGTGSFVEAGTTIGFVAAPTRYFSLEGSNLYFALQKDGEPVDPESFF